MNRFVPSVGEFRYYVDFFMDQHSLKKSYFISKKSSFEVHISKPFEKLLDISARVI